MNERGDNNGVGGDNNKNNNNNKTSRRVRIRRGGRTLSKYVQYLPAVVHRRDTVKRKIIKHVLSPIERGGLSNC